MEERLAKLERENRRLRVLSWTAFLSVAVLFLMGQALAPTVHDSLSVRELRLVDESGTLLARLGTLVEGGAPTLTLHNEDNGEIGSVFSAFVFWFLDDSGIRAILSILDRGPHLELMDDKGTTRAVLGSTSLVTTRTGVTEGRPESSLVLFGPDGKVIEAIP